MSFPVLLHVGVPKSGTTTLQYSFFPRHPDVRYLGKPYPDETVAEEMAYATAHLLEYLHQTCGLSYEDRHAAALYEKGIAPRLGERKITVLSEEALTGAGGADRKLICQRLRSLFGEAKILITIREQKQALLSGYRYAYTRHLIPGSPDNWIGFLSSFSYYYSRPEDFPLRQYKYARLYEEYAEAFGPNQVLVLPLEMLRQDPSTFAIRLSAFCGIDQQTSVALLQKVERHNISYGALGMWYQRQLKSYYRMKKHFNPNVDIRPWGVFDEGFHGHVMATLAGVDHAPKGFSRSTIAFLDDYYAEDNATFSQLTGLDLAGYGYSIPQGQGETVDH
jgi:hypothetical protein